MVVWKNAMNYEEPRVKKINRASEVKNMCRAILHGHHSLIYSESFFFLLSAPSMCLGIVHSFCQPFVDAESSEQHS